MSLWQQGLCYVAWLGAVFTLAEWLRSQKVESEIVRKVIHIGVGNIILLAWWLQVPQYLGVAFSLVFSLVALLSHRLKILPSLNEVGRKSLGTFFYALSVGILLALFWQPPHQPFAVIGILVMTWGDALAALVGQRWGSHVYTIGSIRKSWEGSLTMWLISSLVIALLMSSVVGGSLFITGLSLMLGGLVAGLEIFSWWGIDNLTVPLSSGVLSYGLWWLLQAH
ncbi:MAG: SEC59/DGK1/VTE5 family protein [Synechococcales cyanobacterium]